MRLVSTALTLALAAALLIAPGSASADEIAVIAHPQLPVTRISAPALADIYKGQSSRLDGGERVTPVDQARGARIREGFYRAVANMSAGQINAYWSRLLFTGKRKPPRALADDAAVLDFVATTPGAIGYVDRAKVDSRVKVVLTLP